MDDFSNIDPSTFNAISLLAPNLVNPSTGQVDPAAVQAQRGQNMLLGAAGGMADIPYASRLPIGLGQYLSAGARGLLQGQQLGDENLRRNLLAGPAYQSGLNQALLGNMTVQGYRNLQNNYPGPVTAPNAIANAGSNAPAAPSNQKTYFDALFNSESANNPSARNPNSTAIGLGQFTSGTWSYVYNKYLAAQGFPNDPTNPAAAKAATAYLAAENASVLRPWLNRDPTNSELGLAHFLGAQGSLKVLGAPADAKAIDFASPEAVTANRSVFFNGDGSPRTVGQLTGDFEKRFAGTAPLLTPPLLNGGTGANGGTSILSAPANPQAAAGGNVTAQGNTPPLIDPTALWHQYQVYSRIPGMQGVAQQVLSLLEKGLPPGYRIGADGQYHIDPSYLQGETQLAGGKKAAELPFTLSTVRPGGVQLQGGQPIFQSPVQITGVDAQGRPTAQFVTPAMPNGNPGAAPPPANNSGAPVPIGPDGPRVSNVPAPSASGSSAPSVPASNNPQTYVTGLDPLTRASLEKRGTELEEYGKELQIQAGAAVNQQFLIDQMRRESGAGAGWEPGRFAEWVGDVRAMLQGALGNKLSPDSLNEALANYQAFQKNGMQLTMQATRAMSARAAVQEMQMIQQALPSVKLSNGGLGYIFDQLSANNDFARAKAQAAESWRSGHSGTLAGFDSDWNQNVSPFAFLVHRISAPDLQTMASNLQQTAQGRALLNRIQTEMRWAAQRNLFQDGTQ